MTTLSVLKNPVAIAACGLIGIAALSKFAASYRPARELSRECRHNVQNATQNLLLARQDQNRVFRLVHCAYARAYLNAAMHAMDAETLSQLSRVHILRLSRSIDEFHDTTLTKLNPYRVEPLPAPRGVASVDPLAPRPSFH